ncbi:hypothetical protein ACQY0O_005984 [Thecaphora frezii]
MSPHLRGYAAAVTFCLVLAGQALAKLSNGVLEASDIGEIDILYQNDLSNTVATGAILLHQPVPASRATAVCHDLNENLLPTRSNISDIVDQLNYLAFTGKVSQWTSFWVDGGSNGPSVAIYDGRTLRSSPKGSTGRLPVLCTNTAPATSFKTADPVPKASFYGANRQFGVSDGDYKFVGIRDRRSFRFLGIPFADPPIGNKRFMQATPYTGSRNINATEYGKACIQPESDMFNAAVHEADEDCLQLNIWTTSLPSPDRKAKEHLKPVFVWIYGGAYRGGRNSLPFYDGSNMASRGDIVVVNLNYRLGALGFLASGNDIPGNAGISDQIMALKWVQGHISAFGGDPNKVTIGGESAGAQSVAAILSSKATAGLYRSTIMQSAPDMPWHSKSLATNVIAPHVADFVGCPKFGTAMVKCLQAVDAKRFGSILKEGLNSLVLSNAVAGYFVGTATNAATEPLLPVVDNLIDDQFFYFLGNGTLPNKVPLLIGTLTGEATLFVERTQKSPLLAIDPIYRIGLGMIFTGPIADKVLASGLFNLQPSNPDTIRDRLDELTTLTSWSCPTYRQMQTGTSSGSLVKTYLYEMDTGVPFSDAFPAKCQANATGLSACHSADLVLTMGNLNFLQIPLDPDLLEYERHVNDYWTSFVRHSDPNAPSEYLKARGRSYESTLSVVTKSPWKAMSTSKEDQKLQRLYKAGFSEGPYPYAEKCAFFDSVNGLTYKRFDNVFGIKP